jgi:hypothetical protein
MLPCRFWANVAESKSDYYSGYIAALRDYAWWLDGVQYVGCGMNTMEDAMRVAKELYGSVEKAEQRMSGRRK